MRNLATTKNPKFFLVGIKNLVHKPNFTRIFFLIFFLFCLLKCFAWINEIPPVDTISRQLKIFCTISFWRFSFRIFGDWATEFIEKFMTKLDLSARLTSTHNINKLERHNKSCLEILFTTMLFLKRFVPFFYNKHSHIISKYG